MIPQPRKKNSIISGNIQNPCPPWRIVTLRRLRGGLLRHRLQGLHEYNGCENQKCCYSLQHDASPLNLQTFHAPRETRSFDSHRRSHQASGPMKESVADSRGRAIGPCDPTRASFWAASSQKLNRISRGLAPVAILLGSMALAANAAAADVDNGQRIAQSRCAACHIVVAPNQQRDLADAPPFEAIARKLDFNADLLAPRGRLKLGLSFEPLLLGTAKGAAVTRRPSLTTAASNAAPATCKTRLTPDGRPCSRARPRSVH
jgi:hypothetical protein